ncbi:MAG TPA: sialate O-acetylesterase, partial [Flavobacteriales bacterium]|nr:sialate O-acetylesterase [Flavobacteriales bacterium]
DNGSWQPYAIGVNNAHTGATTTDQIGPEFSAAITLRDAVGAPINIIKCAYSSTGLCPWINETTPPGTWNPTATYAGNRYTAIEYFVRRGIEDFRDANPGVLCKLAGVIWWDGESDANANVTTAQYTTQFNSLLNYMRPELAALFDNDSTEAPQWNLVSLSFRRNAKEALINTALSNIAAAVPAAPKASAAADPDIHYVDSWPYPRCQNLTTAQASPIAKGTPNSQGGNDNMHASHIAELAVGELCAENILAAGWVAP